MNYEYDHSFVDETTPEDVLAQLEHRRPGAYDYTDITFWEGPEDQRIGLRIVWNGHIKPGDEVWEKIATDAQLAIDQHRGRRANARR